MQASQIGPSLKMKSSGLRASRTDPMAKEEPKLIAIVSPTRSAAHPPTNPDCADAYLCVQQVHTFIS